MLIRDDDHYTMYFLFIIFNNRTRFAVYIEYHVIRDCLEDGIRPKIEVCEKIYKKMPHVSC